jgi:hypothetical protein
VSRGSKAWNQTSSQAQQQKFIIMNWNVEVLRQSWPAWLAKADRNDGQITRLPEEAFEGVKGEIAEWGTV